MHLNAKFAREIHLPARSRFSKGRCSVTQRLASVFLCVALRSLRFNPNKDAVVDEDSRFLFNAFQKGQALRHLLHDAARLIFDEVMLHPCRASRLHEIGYAYIAFA